MKVSTEATILTRSMARTAVELEKYQLQASSGQQNPDPATNPLDSTISKKLSADISAITHVRSVVSGAKSTVETALVNLKLSVDLLNQMETLAIKANTNLLSPQERTSINRSFQQKISQFDANAKITWGSRVLFDGTFSMNVQIGLQATEVTTVDLGDMTAATLLGAIDITSQINAQAAETAINTARATVLNEISRLQLYSDDFDRTDNSMETATLNLQETLAGYNDADFATAVSNSERLSVLQDAGMAVLKSAFNSFDKLGKLVGDSLHR